MPNQRRKTINADADFGTGEPFQGQDIQPKRKGMDYWEKSDWGESVGLMKGLQKARYRDIIGDTPRLEPDDRVGATQYYNKILKAINTYGEREDGVEGHWTGIERQNLKKLRDKWYKRSLGLDPWFKQHGNKETRKRPKQNRYNEEAIEALKGKEKERRVDELLGKTKRVWVKTGTHGVTGEAIYGWRNQRIAQGSRARLVSDTFKKSQERDQREALASRYRAERDREEKIQEIERKIEQVSGVAAAIEIWRETVEEGKEMMTGLSEKAPLRKMQEILESMQSVRLWADQFISRISERQSRAREIPLSPIGASTRVRG